jgi:hypothetical protein
MEDIGSWAWLIIAIFVVVTRVLPRLFRGKTSTEEVPETPRHQPPPEPEPIQEGTGTGMDLETLAKSLALPRPKRGASAPPPIEPK